MDGPRRVSHDQNFKNLIIDYPRQAIELFSPEEAGHIGPNRRGIEVRGFQKSERTGGDTYTDSQRTLSPPLLGITAADWPLRQTRSSRSPLGA